MVFNFLSGQFIDVIEWTDDTRDTMVWRFERYGHEIKYGAKLTVREGQTAVFIHEGQLADIFTPGLYMLETNNMPILTTLQHWDHGFKSPFKSEIYFVNTNRFTNLKWGTKEPDHAARPGVRADPHPRLRHLHREGRRRGPFHDRDRGHGWGVHDRRDHLPDPQRHRAGIQPRGRGIRHPGARHGRQHGRVRQAGGRPHLRDDRAIRPDPARALYREHLAAPRGSNRRSTSAPPWAWWAI